MFGADRSLARKGVEAFAQRKWRRARDLLEDAVAEQPLTPSADYHLGLLYWRALGGERDPRAAVACFLRAADDGHAGAQTALGVALMQGVGVRRDLNEARELFRAAAGAGNAVAMVQLAALSDEREAHRWLSRAADEAYPPAMRALGEHLMAEDPVDALAWLYTHVAITGDHASIKRAAALARELSASEISAAQKHGRAYAKNARHTAEQR